MLKAQALPSLAKLPENPVSGITPWFIASLGIVFFSYTLEVKKMIYRVLYCPVLLCQLRDSPLSLPRIYRNHEANVAARDLAKQWTTTPAKSPEHRFG